MCVDSAAHKAALHKPVGLYPCHLSGGNQVSSINGREPIFVLGLAFGREFK